MDGITLEVRVRGWSEHPHPPQNESSSSLLPWDGGRVPPVHSIQQLPVSCCLHAYPWPPRQTLVLAIILISWDHYHVCHGPMAFFVWANTYMEVRGGGTLGDAVLCLCHYFFDPPTLERTVGETSVKGCLWSHCYKSWQFAIIIGVPAGSRLCAITK